MKATFLTLFPEALTSMLDASILGRAKSTGIVDVQTVQIRDFATDKHRTVDDSPSGGGAGMVMRADVVGAAIADVKQRDARAHVVLLDARGATFTQAHARRLSALPHVAFVCGRYEGVDARVEAVVDDVLSIGDFVLTGGEIAALAIFDAVVRLLPGALGNDASPVHDSHSALLLEHRQYTRPVTHNGLSIPDVLQQGNHAAIAKARRADSLLLTRARRPDLFVRAKKSAADDALVGDADDGLAPVRT